MSMMPAAIIINAPESVSQADAAAEAAASATERVAKNAKREERKRTRAIIADFEAHLRRLDENPPQELSPVKLQGVRESLRHTIDDLRRQIAPLSHLKG